MFLPEFCIRRPVTATVMVLLLVVFGIIGMGRLGVLLFPDVDFPVVAVTTIWPSARPEEVDTNITDELEDALGGIEGIKHIASDSYQGISRITIEFELYKDVDVGAQEVRDKISSILYKLPEDAEVPVIDKVDINANPVIWMSLFGQRPIEEITDYADKTIKPLLQKLEGVGNVYVYGREREVKIWLNRDRLARYNIGVDEVIRVIKAQHIEVPGGKVESSTKEFVIRTLGEFHTEAAFNDLIVAYRQGNAIRIRDLGYAEAGREDFISEVRYFSPGNKVYKAVGVGVAPRSGANEVEMSRLVKKEVTTIRQMLPPGMFIEISSDDTIFIETSIEEVKFQLLIGGIMAALVVFLFLQNVRTTIFTSIAIPTSIISTFAAIYAFGFTLNNLTMLALVSAVGLVIDDSIIMEENIYRHRFELKKPAMQAALEGSREIGFAVLASTLTLAGVFLPVAFMGGIVGRFFKEFALTMAFAVGCSMFVALTIEPMLASRFLKPGGERWLIFRTFEHIMNKGREVYRHYIALLLNHRYLVIFLMLLALLGGGYFFKMIGKELITSEDRSQFMVNIECPLSYSIYKTDKAITHVEKLLQEPPEVESYFVVSGYSVTGVPEANKGLFFVSLVPKTKREKSQQQLMVEVRRKLKTIPDLRALVSEVSLLGGGTREEEVQFVIQGPGLEGLDNYSRQIMDRMEKLPGFVDIDRNLELEKPEVRLLIDRDKAADLGVDVRTIADAVGALIGGIDVVEFKSGGESYDVRLRLLEDERTLPTDVDRIWVHTQKGETVDLASFVSIQTGVGPSVINRMDRQRAVTIFANLENKTLGEAQKEINQILKEILPEGYTTKYMGRGEAFRETGYYIMFAFVLATILTYMILSAQFESFVYPLSIMMGLPLSFVGAFGLLYFTGNTLNIFSMIALVLLVGLPAKNGILLVDRANQLRAQGTPLKEALVEAAGTRLRPILMTACSTMAGVIPVALGIGVGSESRQPMAIAIAGGMFSSTLLTLVVVPIIYSYLDDFTRLRIFSRIKRRVWVDEDEVAN
ncbi:MAG: efflux RND transporter permease subunit [Pseudomonadota bacterium]